MLAGLTSRWIAPRLWAKSRASATCASRPSASFGLQRPAAGLTFEQLGEADAVDQLGDEVHRPFELAPLVDGDDVRVAVERRGDLGLVDESLADHVIGRVPIGEHLERHFATESEVRRRVHDRGAATMDRLVESVLVDDLTGLKRHERSPEELGSSAAGKYGSRTGHPGRADAPVSAARSGSSAASDSGVVKRSKLSAERGQSPKCRRRQDQGFSTNP